MTNKKIQLTTNVDGQSVNVYPVTKSEFVEFPDGKTLDEKIDSASTEHKHDLATPAKDGFMSKEDKAKLDGVTNYTHPNTHAATMITEDNDHRFVTDAEKNKWNNKADTSLATNASNGLMSASDKQKIDDLNNQFKNRDDKIEKNKEDIKKLNSEVIEKDYAYFNNQSTVLNTIAGKTKDMIIKGKTLHNVFSPISSKISLLNAVSFSDGTYLFQPREREYSNIWDTDNLAYKPNTEYTVVIDIIENKLEKLQDVESDLCYIAFGYETNESVFGTQGLKKSIANNFTGKIVAKVRTISDFSTLKENYGARIFLINRFKGGSLKVKITIFEGDWINQLVPNNIKDGLQSFGEKIEENKYKINAISIGKNLFDKNQFSDYLNEKDELVFKQDGNSRVNNHFIIHTSKNPYSTQLISAGYAPESKTFRTINQEKYYILMGLNGNNRDNKVWGEILLPRNTTCTFSSINNSGDNAWVSFKDIQIEIGDSKTKYQDYKANKANIYLKDDLKQINEDIFDYINYDLNICRNIKRHIFTEKDAWLQGSCNNSTHIGFYVLWNTIGGKINGKCRCNNFRLISLSEYNDANVEGYLSDIGFNIKIAKNRLPSGTIEGFKEWLKTNPIEVLFEAENPIIEKCDCLDTNLYTYSGNTFITCDNDVKGDMSFTVPMNLGASFDNNSDRIDLIEDTLKNNNDNKSRIEKLEEGAITSSLNIIDLQKDVKNNNDYTHYSGNNISIVNSKESRTSNMIIKGKTLQNFLPSTEIDSNYDLGENSKKDGELFIIPYGQNANTSSVRPYKEKSVLLKEGQAYTIVINIIENTANQKLGLSQYKSVLNPSKDSFDNLTGISKIKCTARGDSNEYTHLCYFCIWAPGGNLSTNIKFKAMILEGDWTEKEVPDYFEGLKSLGEKENKITILSHGKNYFNTSMEVGAYNSKGEKVEWGNYIRCVDKIRVKDQTKYFITSTPKKTANLQYWDANGDIMYGNYDDVSNGFITPKRCKFITFNLMETNISVEDIESIQIEEGDKATEFEKYKESIKNIPLKEPLHRDNFIYEEDGKIKIYKTFKKYVFTGNEDFIPWSNREGKIGVAFKIPDKKNREAEGYCNKLSVYDRLIYGDDSSKQCVGVQFWDVIENMAISLKASDLKTPDIDGIKAKLKEWYDNKDPLTIIYKLKTPIIEEYDVVDLNVKTFDNYTNISLLDSISGDLEFNVVNNLVTQNLNNSKNINKVIDELQNVKNEFIDKDLCSYEGNNLNYNSNKETYTCNTFIKGLSLKNNVLTPMLNKTYNANSTQIMDGYKVTRKKDTVYTLIAYVSQNSLNSNFSFISWGRVSDNGPIYIGPKVAGLIKKVFTTNSNIYEDYFFELWKENTSGSITIDYIMILEGDWSNKTAPLYFEGIKSFGEQENNQINLVSCNDNFAQSINKRITLSVGDKTDYYEIYHPPVGELYHGLLLNNQLVKASGVIVLFYDKDKKQIEWLTINDTPRFFNWNNIIEKAKYYKIHVANGESITFDNFYLSPKKYYIENSNHKKTTTLKQPLRGLNNIEDCLYDNSESQLSVYREIKEYVFTGNENFTVWNGASESSGCTYFNLDNTIDYCLTENNCLCNNLETLNSGSDSREGISLRTKGDFSRVYISIKKDKLESSTVEGLKKWLKNNRTVLLYQSYPYVENINNSINMSIKAFKGMNYVSVDNNITNKIGFKVPKNLSTIVEKNSNDIDKISKIVKSVDKIYNLEEAQMTTALNVLELQKHTAMLNNGKVDDYTNYSGTFIKYNNGLDSRTENMTIKGKTLVNLVKHRLTNQKVGGSSSWSAGLGTNEMFKINTPYTIVYTINSIENGTKKTTLNFSGGMDIPDILLESSNSVGTHKETFVLKNQPSRTHTNVSLYHLNDNSTVKSFSDVMIFEGEIDFIPKYFEGIKSFGEEEKVGDKYKINIISHSKNLLPDSEKTVFKEGHNCEFIQYGDLAPIFDKYGLKDYTISFDLKSKDISKHNTIQVYCQNGESAKYDIGQNIINVTTEFKRYSIIVRPNLAYPNDKKSYLAFYGNYETGNAPVVKNVKVEEGKVESPLYEPYIEDKRDVLINEPLYKGNYIIEENNNINLYKRYDKYIFNGNENWILGTSGGGWGEYEDTLVFYVASFEQAHVNSSFLCDKFIFLNVVNNNVIGIYNAVWGSAPHPAIRIKKTELETKDVEGFKKWLKNNPVTIIYEIKDPITKAINCTDINVDTYKDITYVNTSNSIKGELEFKTQNNFGAIMKNVNRCISKIFNSLNNILNIKGE